MTAPFPATEASATRLFPGLDGKSVLVVGAGIQGLSTGMLCAAAGAHVTIVGERTGADTTSAGAAAFWCPYFIPNTPPATASRWAGMTMTLFRALLAADIDCGLQFARGTELTVNDPIVHPWSKHAIDFEVLTPAAAARYGTVYRGGVRFTSVISDPTYFMPFLRALLGRTGAVFVERRVESLAAEATTGRYDAIFNCSGLGARTLADDPDVIPVRGQVIKVHAPAVKEWIVDMDGPCACGYVLPRASGIVVLGGTHTENDANEANSDDDIRGVMHRTATLAPAVKNAPVLAAWAGLRPVRVSGVRVELTTINNVPIIHNYGHGGSGWTLFWGTAHDALHLACQSLAESDSGAGSLPTEPYVLLDRVPWRGKGEVAVARARL